MDMEVEDIRNGREGQGHTKHANIKKKKNEHDHKQHPRILEYSRENSQDKRKY